MRVVNKWTVYLFLLHSLDMLEWCHLLFKPWNDWSFRCLLFWMRRSGVTWTRRLMGGQEAKEKSPWLWHLVHLNTNSCYQDSIPLLYNLLLWQRFYIFCSFFCFVITFSLAENVVSFWIFVSPSVRSTRTHLRISERLWRHLGVFVWCCYNPADTYQ